MGEIMQFPETVEEFMQQYKITDTQQVYTNGTELVPIFRMKQWFEAHKQHNSCKCSLDEAPTVDAVSVVRCRECISFEKIGELPDGMPFGYCSHWDYESGMSPNKVDGDDFCSYGERRPDNDA